MLSTIHAREIADLKGKGWWLQRHSNPCLGLEEGVPEDSIIGDRERQPSSLLGDGSELAGTRVAPGVVPGSGAKWDPFSFLPRFAESRKEVNG